MSRGYQRHWLTISCVLWWHVDVMSYSFSLVSKEMFDTPTSFGAISLKALSAPPCLLAGPVQPLKCVQAMIALSDTLCCLAFTGRACGTQISCFFFFFFCLHLLLMRYTPLWLVEAFARPASELAAGCLTVGKIKCGKSAHIWCVMCTCVRSRCKIWIA